MIIACQKQFKSDNPDNLIFAAKNYFLNEIVQNENKMLASLSNSAADSYKRRFARMKKLGDRLNWNEAAEYKESGISYIIVPLRESRKPFSNKDFEAARFFAFYKEGAENMKMKIIEIISSKGGTLGNNISQIANKSFVNKYFGKKDNVYKCNAMVLFYDDQYNHELSFEIKNGLWGKGKINLNVRDDIKNRPLSTRGQQTTCQTCVHWYWLLICYDLQTGQIIWWTILDEWDECTQNGPPPSGYGGSTTPEVDVECDQEFQDILSAGSATHEKISVEVTDETSTTRTVALKWKIYTVASALTTLNVYSHEIGVHYKPDPINSPNVWYYQSLTHSNLSQVGNSAFWTLTATTNTAVPTVTNYSATMDLNYNILIEYVCKGSPFRSNRDYPAQESWSSYETQ
jgi:hypothetical protein